MSEQTKYSNQTDNTQYFVLKYCVKKMLAVFLILYSDIKCLIF